MAIKASWKKGGRWSNQASNQIFRKVVVKTKCCEIITVKFSIIPRVIKLPIQKNLKKDIVFKKKLMFICIRVKLNKEKRTISKH